MKIGSVKNSNIPICVLTDVGIVGIIALQKGQAAALFATKKRRQKIYRRKPIKSTTLKKLSAMMLAFLMVVTMASVLAVSAELKTGARTLGSPESLTLGDSSNYATLGDISER